MIISTVGTKIEQKDYIDEKELQELVFRYPELLAEDGTELVGVKRELSTSAGRIDALMLSASGVITIVEVKLDRNSQSRRDVLAQIFDYISALSDYSYFELNRVTGNKLDEAVSAFENSAELPRIIEDNLRSGLVRLVIVVDESNNDLHRLMEFVSKHTKLRVDLVEVKKYYNDNEFYYSSTPIIQSSFAFNNVVEKKYPLLDKVVGLWKADEKLPRVKNKTGSFRQILIENWPAAVHYEFTIMYNKPIVYVRLDNELAATDPRNDKISIVMDKFAGKMIMGYTLMIRPYGRTGSGRVLYIPVEENDIDKAPAIMKKLISLTKGALDEAFGMN